MQRHLPYGKKNLSCAWQDLAWQAERGRPSVGGAWQKLAEAVPENSLLLPKIAKITCNALHPIAKKSELCLKTLRGRPSVRGAWQKLAEAVPKNSLLLPKIAKITCKAVNFIAKVF